MLVHSHSKDVCNLRIVHFLRWKCWKDIGNPWNDKIHECTRLNGHLGWEDKHRTKCSVDVIAKQWMFSRKIHKKLNRNQFSKSSLAIWIDCNYIFDDNVNKTKLFFLYTSVWQNFYLPLSIQTFITNRRLFSTIEVKTY